MISVSSKPAGDQALPSQRACTSWSATWRMRLLAPIARSGQPELRRPALRRPAFGSYWSLSESSAGPTAAAGALRLPAFLSALRSARSFRGFLLR